MADTPAQQKLSGGMRHAARLACTHCLMRGKPSEQTNKGMYFEGHGVPTEYGKQCI